MIQKKSVDTVPPSLEPVEGIGVEHWAWGMAQISLGETPAYVARRLEIELGRWERAALAWNERAKADGTGILTGEIRKYGGVASNTETPVTEEEPSISLEDTVEMRAALEVAAIKGWNPDTVLSHFGTDRPGFERANNFWREKISFQELEGELYKFHLRRWLGE